jgi:hypothetical protein
MATQIMGWRLKVINHPRGKSVTAKTSDHVWTDGHLFICPWDLFRPDESLLYSMMVLEKITEDFSQRWEYHISKKPHFVDNREGNHYIYRCQISRARPGQKAESYYAFSLTRGHAIAGAIGKWMKGELKEEG